MARYYYRGDDGSNHGPLEEGEMKALYEAGEVEEETMVIPEGKKKWKRYYESFWVPPPLEGDAHRQASRPSSPYEPPPPSMNWDEAIYLALCPSCGERFQIRGKALGKKRLTCPACGRKQTGKALREIKLEDGQRIEYRRFSKLLSYKGRVGRLEYWLFFLLPGGFLWGVEPFAGILWMLLPGMPTAVKRLQDLGNSGQWMWVPMIHLFLASSYTESGDSGSDPMTALFYVVLGLGSFVVGVMMAFLKGNKQANRDGPPVEQTERVWG